MTTRPLFASRRTGLLGLQPRPRKPRYRDLALVAAAAIVLSASILRLDASARRPIDPAPLHTPRAVATGPALVPAVLTVMPPKSRDALVAMLAQKYRVSREATRELVDAAYREGGRNGLDPLLIIAVIGVESRFNPIAQSDGGAMGLMQVIPRYHGDKFDAAGGESVLDPRVNIHVGARALKEYIRRGGTETAGLQLYNGALDDESSAYAHKVLLEKQRLQSVIRRGS